MKKFVALFTLLALVCAFAQAQGVDKADLHAKAVAKAVDFLKSKQDKDGSWGGPASKGVTGLVTLSLLRSGVKPDDPAVAKALEYIESLVDPKTGHIAGKDAKLAQINYPTAINVMALAEADGKGKYKAVLNKAVDYLKEIQWDESEKKKLEDFVYGGAGYGGGTRPDLSNTHFFLDALLAAGVSPKDSAFKKAVVYVSRCQNFKSENNTTVWAGKINDGSFIYGASEEGETRGDTPADGSKPGYGSMTYAGLKSLNVCGVAKDDPRYTKALEWLQKNYSVDTNPGMPSGSGQRGYYYYLMTMARTLTIVQIDEMTDAAGKKRDWRDDINSALINRQRKNGSWANEIDRWMESVPELTSAYALITLSYTKPKKGS